jgi:hypothetical protein
MKDLRDRHDSTMHDAGGQKWVVGWGVVRTVSSRGTSLIRNPRNSPPQRATIGTEALTCQARCRRTLRSRP